MRKILSWLVLLIVLAVAGIAVLWVLQSSKIEKNFLAQVAQFNTGPMKFTYDAMEISGFPMRMNINVINPKVSGRMDLLLDPNKQQNLPEWKENATLQGTVQVGVDIFSSHVEFNTNGAWKNTSIIGEQTLSLVGKPDNATHCALQIERGTEWISSMWSFKALADRGKEFLSDFRLFDCFSNGMQFMDGQTNALLIQNGPQRFYISSEPQGAQRQVRVYLKGTDNVVTQDGDRLIAQYYRAFSSNALPPMISAYGKQNIEVDFSYTGPIDWQGDPKTTPIDVQLSRFNITNDAYTINTSFALSNVADAQNQSARIAFKSEAVYNQIYNALVHETMRGIITQILSDPKTALTLPPRVIENQTAESLYNLIAPAIPNFYALGKSTAAFDISFQGVPGFASGDFTLTELELSVTPYGITGKGTGKRAPGAFMPTTNLVLNCRNCLQMVHDAMLYNNRIREIVLTLDGTTSLPFFDDKTIQGYKEFLRSLAEDDGAGNFTYTIVSDGKTGVTINKNRMNEILILYHKLVPQPKG